MNLFLHALKCLSIPSENRDNFCLTQYLIDFLTLMRFQYTITKSLNGQCTNNSQMGEKKMMYVHLYQGCQMHSYRNNRWLSITISLNANCNCWMTQIYNGPEFHVVFTGVLLKCITNSTNINRYNILKRLFSGKRISSLLKNFKGQNMVYEQ